MRTCITLAPSFMSDTISKLLNLLFVVDNLFFDQWRFG